MNYFSKKDLIDIETLINENINFYAHTKSGENETLKEHIDRCNKYFFKIATAKNLRNVFKNFEEIYFKDADEAVKKLFRKLLINTINFHDIGKINPKFQNEKMNNKQIKKEIFEGLGSKHSIISSILYLDYFIEEVEKYKELDKKTFKKLSHILFLNSYIISRHHGDLTEFSEFADSFHEGYQGDTRKVIKSLENETYKEIYNKTISPLYKKMKIKCSNVRKQLEENSKEESIYIYTYVKLMFSLLVACDFYATTEFMNDLELDEFGEIKDISTFYDTYKSGEIYKSISEYEKKEYKKEKNLVNEKNINVLRTEMFLDAQNELSKNLDSNIYFLEAPTGSGKSNVSLNLSFKLLENNNHINKIYYIYPYNTLIEQNMKTMKNIFGSSEDIFKNIAVVNSINPIKIDKDSSKKEESSDEFDYEYYAKALLNRQFLNYPMILTTHVSLFNTMFDYKKESAFSFYQLANSVIVLDEIQSYKNTIWTEIITFLKGFAKILNMKVIIMSATLPNLNYLINEVGNTGNLITNEVGNTANLIANREKYFNHQLFRDRVKVIYDLIDKDIDELYNHVKNSSFAKKKIIVEFIKKQSAYDFYNRLKEDEEIQSKIELISGDDNSIERQRILNLVDKTDDIILIATQVVEAGVDIDMDVGYKDISKLDSEEQFMGRINRSCKKSGIIYFFNIDKADSIYKNDIRMNKKFTLENENMKEILINKKFENYYLPVLETIKTHYNGSSDEFNLDNFFKGDVGGLNFKKIKSRMELISDDMWSMSVYLSTRIKTEDNLILDGEEIWNNYKRLLSNNKLEYAKKQVKLSQARSLLNYFIYQVKKIDIPYNDRVGELYFIEDGEKYFRDGKVDKEKLTTGIGDFI